MEDDLDLGEFEDSTVVATPVAITGAGDGLSAALSVAPVMLHIGDRVRVVLDCRVTRVAHQPHVGGKPKAPVEGEVDRVSTLSTQGAIIIDDASSKNLNKLLEASNEAIRRARDEAEGKLELPLGEAAGELGE